MEVFVEIVDGEMRIVPHDVQIVVRNYDIKNSDKWIKDEDGFPCVETVLEEA